LQAEKQIMAQQLCVRYRVSASLEAGCRSIDLTASNKVVNDCRKSVKPAQKNATISIARTLCKCMLLVGLSLIQVGCKEQSRNRFSFPENPTPLPDPSDQIEMGAVHRESGQLLDRSD
jgi:hypothetical protein